MQYPVGPQGVPFVRVYHQTIGKIVLDYVISWRNMWLPKKVVAPFSLMSILCLKRWLKRARIMATDRWRHERCLEGRRGKWVARLGVGF